MALATFNSEAFLAELLDSLFSQTVQGFTLLVSDDCSTDGTLNILEEYAGRYPGRIHLLPPNPRRLGPRGNFGRLTDHATADYLMLCDHDDVWLPEKMALSLERMKALEGVHSPAVPLLVYTDLIVAGPDLQVLGPSFFRYSNIDALRNDLASLLTVNVGAGCAMTVNRALFERARPIPGEAMMHDHWLVLVAAALGAISYLPEPTILYRQHGSNAIGAQAAVTATLIRRIRQTIFSDNRRRLMVRYSRQAAILLARYGREMRVEHREATETLATLWSLSRWRRYVALRRSGVGLRGFIRNAALLLVVARSAPRDAEAREG